MSRVTVNGKSSPCRPNKDLLINKAAHISNGITSINGSVPTNVCINNIARNPVTNGCVLNLPLWHPVLGSSTFKSLCGVGHTCTATGAVWTPHGRKFDGADDKIVVPYHTSLNITGALTFAIWFKFLAAYAAGSAWGVVVDRAWGKVPRDSYTLYFRGTSGDLRLGRTIGSINGTKTSWAAGWYHIVVASGATGGAIYVNTAVIGSTASAGSDTGNLENLIIGETITAENDLTGVIGDFAIYNRSWSAAEVKRNYELTKWRYL